MEEFAFLMAFCLSLMNGIIIPYNACKILGLRISQYLAVGFGRVGLLWAAATVPLIVIHGRQVSTTFLLVLVEIATYCVALGTLYWFFLLSESAKTLIRRKFF